MPCSTSHTYLGVCLIREEKHHPLVSQWGSKHLGESWELAWETAVRSPCRLRPLLLLIPLSTWPALPCVGFLPCHSAPSSSQSWVLFYKVQKSLKTGSLPTTSVSWLSAFSWGWLLDKFSLNLFIFFFLTGGLSRQLWQGKTKFLQRTVPGWPWLWFHYGTCAIIPMDW